MERQLFSGKQLFNKILFSILSISMLGFVALVFIKDSGYNFYPIAAICCIVALYNSYMFIYGVHPVYFDDKFLYWSKNGLEQKVPFVNIKKLHVLDRRMAYVGNLEYRDTQNKARSLRFFLPGVTDPGPAIMDLTIELEKLIQKQQPHFQILMPGYWRDVERSRRV